MSDDLDSAAVESIKACFDRIVKKAGQESIAGVSCDVGYLWMKHQRTLRQAFPDFTVLTTPMMQLPFIWTCFGTNDKTLLVTWKDETDDSKAHHLQMLEDAGIRLDTHRMEILTLNASDPKWSLFLAGMTTQAESQKLVNEVVNMVKEKISQLSDKARPKNDCPKMGLVRLEHEYVAGVGDIDHGSTFQFNSCPEVVPALTFEEAQRGSQNPVILENLKRAVDKMEAEECFGITGNCGFMHFYQQFVRDYATVPVFRSALVQVPAMAAALEPDERLLVLTANESSFMKSRDALLSAEGRPFCDFNRVLVRGCENVPGRFEAVANADLVDNIKVQQHMVSYVKEILEQEKHSDLGPIKAILLECTQMPHYAAAIRQSTELPTFDVVTCANFFAQVLNKDQLYQKEAPEEINCTKAKDSSATRVWDKVSCL
eukprot:Skav235294  [mRNA]  locus=scaffold4363:77071:81167:- [translate_table: standard]